MIPLPSELHIRIIEQAAKPIHPRAYQNHCIPSLLNLCLVNHAFYEWSSPFLYSRVTITLPNGLRQFCRTVVQNWHARASDTPSERWISSSLGAKVKSLALPLGDWEQWDHVPRDEIVAILHALSNTLERLAIDPDAEYMLEEGKVDGRIQTSIEQMRNLREYCSLEFRNASNYYKLPTSSRPTLERLVLFGCGLPHDLPRAVSSFTSLETLAFVLPSMNYKDSRCSAEVGQNLLEIIEEIGNQLKEVMVYLRKPPVNPIHYIRLIPLSVLRGSSEGHELTARFSPALNKLRFTSPSRLGARRNEVIQALLSGELWSEAGYQSVELSYHLGNENDP
ncbi:hypothetical protein FRC02_004969 [Tulasnella sp. 418]|nr:hypothetical protein FRC02_004969 [Tulasnella sp. 418]